MLSLIIEVLTLGFGMLLLSPGIFAVAVLLLSSKVKPITKSFLFLLGNILTLIILFLAWMFIGTSLHDNFSGAVRVLDIIFGILLLVFAYKVYFYERKEKAPNKKEGNIIKLWLFFGLGFIASISNIDAEALYLISINEISESGIAIFNQFILFLFSSIMLIMAAALPLLIYFIFPKSSKKILEFLGRLLRKYGRILMVVLLVILGLWFLKKGIFV
ncbi:MAG: GAP family protein [Candidatus Pacearchaeota archaeon]|jgi:threonine/homoserine/homoserine lactone efflux protein